MSKNEKVACELGGSLGMMVQGFVGCGKEF